MSDRINLLQRAENVEKSPLFNTYAKVIVNIDDETQASAGSGAGRTMEITNPLFGGPTLASNLLRRLQGYQYQPYSAQGTLLDPAAEIGDAVSVNDVYGGIYARDKQFGRLMVTDISAPYDEEINHEYKWESKTDRKLRREMENVQAEFEIQATQIAAKVSTTGGNNSSFGWVLDSTSHTWYSGNQRVMRVDSSGLEVTGKVTATSGKIGNFNISSTSIYNGMTSLNDTTHNGVYMGTDGIALGKGAFKVTASGSVSANNMILTGTLKIGGTNITADALRSGAQSAYNNGGNWTSAYNSTSYGGYCYNGATNGNSAQTTWNNARNSSVGIDYIRADAAQLGSLGVLGSLSCSSFVINGWGFSRAYSSELGTYVWTAVGY